jgi:soluble lytic murein transglycosylase-like protein
MNIPGHSATTVNGTAAKPPDKAGDAKLRKATKDFEAVFVSYLMKTMRGNSANNEMFGESFGGDMMDGVFDLEMAKQISRNSRNGIADILYRQIKGREASAAGSQGNTQPAAPDSTAVKPAAAGRPSAPKKDAGLQERLSRYESSINGAAQQFGLDPNLIRAMIATESGGHPNASSPKEAKGLMQLIDSTATAVGVKNVWNPEENITGGAKYMKSLLDRFQGDVKLALAAYNAGPGAVEKYDSIPPYRETKEYVNRVMNFIDYFDQSEK